MVTVVAVENLSVPNTLVKTAPSSVYKGYTAVVMAMGEPHDEQTPTRLLQREALMNIGPINAPI